MATAVIKRELFTMTRSHTCLANEDLESNISDADSHADNDAHNHHDDGDDDKDGLFLADMRGNSDTKTYDPSWKHPFTSCLAGPTGSGKTAFVLCMIQNMKEMISPVPEKVIYCYGEFQPVFGKFPYIRFHEGLPDSSMFDGKPTLLVLDDLMSEANDSITDLFTKGAHHKSISVIFLTQNIFYKKHRTISLNSHYIVVFKNPRDAYQIGALARQMYPGKSQYMIEAYKDATIAPHSYLLLDLHPEQDEKLRLRTNIFPGELQAVYVQK
jgi:hypothetical protein